MSTQNDTADEAPLLNVKGLSKYFAAESGIIAGLLGTDDVKAVDDVSFTLQTGETLALVGESGCGKSTLARTILQLESPTDGTVQFKGQEISGMSERDLRPLRKDMQMIFQDPQSSLNPRMKVGPIIEEPMEAHGLYDAPTREQRAKELLELVDLDPEYYNRYPHEFSGGQRQRINLARAMSTNPDLIVCDEPVSALDVSVQAQVLNTMRDLQDEFGFSYLFISHDLSVVRYIADRVAVMYLGRIAELAEKETLFESPEHPYTRALLDAIPVPDPRTDNLRTTLAGDVPSPIDPPDGCRFRTRCPHLIPPDTMDVNPDTWASILSFVRAIQRRTLSFETDTEAAINQHIDEQFFPAGRPDAVAESVSRVCAAIADDDWESAQELVTERFERSSICGQSDPEYMIGTDHFVSCHLQDDQYEPYRH